MRPLLVAALIALSTTLAAQALTTSEKGDAKKTDRCIDACISAQRTCVMKSATIADKTKCTNDNASCSTTCPLPNGKDSSKH